MTAAVPTTATPTPRRHGRLHRALYGVSARSYSGAVTIVLVAPLLLLLAFAFYLPILQFLSRSVLEPLPSLDNFLKMIDRPVYTTVLLRTFRTAAIVAAFAALLGFPLAYLMSTLRGWRLVVVSMIVILPMWVSVLVRTYAWTAILGRHGIANETMVALGLIDEPVKLLGTEFAVWLAMTHILMPMMVLTIYSSLRNIPRELAPAAQSLGASWPRVLWHVILPLSMPGVAAGVVLVFISALGYFITPMLLGGPSQMMIATLISTQATKLLDWPFAAALAAVLLVITLALVLVFNRVLRLDRVLGNA